MRLVSGVLGLLVVVAIVAALARTQLQTVQASVAEPGASAAPAQQVQRKVADDVNRLMQQAPARHENGGY